MINVELTIDNFTGEVKEAAGMTEATLEQAVEIKKELDSARKRQKFLVSKIDEAYHPDMIDGMRFSILVESNDAAYRESEIIRPETAEAALCSEIKETMRKIESLEKKLDEMH